MEPNAPFQAASKSKPLFPPSLLPWGGTLLLVLLAAVFLEGAISLLLATASAGLAFGISRHWMLTNPTALATTLPPAPQSEKLPSPERLIPPQVGWELSKGQPEPLHLDTASGHKILVIEDDPALADAICFSLEDIGVCEKVGDPLLVWERALAFQPDCILCDVMMPNLNGLELVRRFKNDPAFMGVPFAFLTALTSREDVLEGLRAGADDYMVKPFDIEILRSKVQVLLRLRRLQIELASSERLRLLGQTVVALNHEINNPLMGLLCSLELLALEPDLPPSIQARLEGITDMTLRIQNVIRKLSGLQSVRTRDYVPGVSMLDLS